MWGPVRLHKLLVLRCPQTIRYGGLLRFARNAPMPQPVTGRAGCLALRSRRLSLTLAYDSKIHSKAQKQTMVKIRSNTMSNCTQCP